MISTKRLSCVRHKSNEIIFEMHNENYFKSPPFWRVILSKDSVDCKEKKLNTKNTKNEHKSSFYVFD